MFYPASWFNASHRAWHISSFSLRALQALKQARILPSSGASFPSAVLFPCIFITGRNKSWCCTKGHSASTICSVREFIDSCNSETVRRFSKYISPFIRSTTILQAKEHYTGQLNNTNIMTWQRLQVQEAHSVPTMATVPQKTLWEENIGETQTCYN